MLFLTEREVALLRQVIQTAALMWFGAGPPTISDTKSSKDEVTGERESLTMGKVIMEEVGMHFDPQILIDTYHDVVKTRPALIGDHPDPGYDASLYELVSLFERIQQTNVLSAHEGKALHFNSLFGEQMALTFDPHPLPPPPPGELPDEFAKVWLFILDGLATPAMIAHNGGVLEDHIWNAKGIVTESLQEEKPPSTLPVAWEEYHIEIIHTSQTDTCFMGTYIFGWASPTADKEIPFSRIGTVVFKTSVRLHLTSDRSGELILPEVFISLDALASADFCRKGSFPHFQECMEERPWGLVLGTPGSTWFCFLEGANMIVPGDGVFDVENRTWQAVNVRVTFQNTVRVVTIQED